MRQTSREIPVSSGSAAYREPKLICRLKDADFFQLCLIIDLLNYVETIVFILYFPKVRSIKKSKYSNLWD